MVLQDLAYRIENAFSSPWTLQKFPEFPFSEYSDNLGRYASQLKWFTGEALKDTEKNKDGEEVPLYPVRVNPINALVLKHAYALFGEQTDDARPPVIPKLIGENENEKTAAEVANHTLNMLWWENFPRTLFMTSGIQSQIFGGTVLGLRRVPWEKRRNIKLRIEAISPECFIGTPTFGDQYRLQEAWVAKPIRWQDAVAYGQEDAKKDIYRPYWWIEHWTPDEFSFWINDKPVVYTMTDFGVKPSGKNQYGFIPYVYIPHIRTGPFYGLNSFDNVRGLVSEINLRLADYGDAVNADSHAYTAFSNVTSIPKVEDVAEGLRGLILPSSGGITGNEPEPQVHEVRKAMASAAMKDLYDLLIQQFRRDAAMPAVADGEDEGSQRSALTLAMRMWPLTAHTNMERTFWTDGLNWFNTMALSILEEVGEGSITKDHLKMRIKQEWCPTLPRDTTEEMNQLINRFTANFGDPEDLLAQAGVEDPSAQLGKIQEWITFLEEAKAKAAAKFAPPPAPPGEKPASKPASQKKGE